MKRVFEQLEEKNGLPNQTIQWCLIRHLIHFTCLGEMKCEEYVKAVDQCSDSLITNRSKLLVFTILSLTITLPSICANFSTYNLEMSCVHSSFISHLIAWLWYAVGVSVGSNCTRCWQRQTASPAAGPCVAYRAPSVSPGPAPCSRTVHSPKPEGGKG